ncbi:MAG: bifunctional demethylmenaquinone methyltransferase/2-methoxy-6-polyprenyl-1,4-benzoquinol methylase UbiE [Bacteroidetes bacterium]|nr:bifunctional demethylmenaquinone methyltransferase/2-methoxy-6-polyprenyl-1,4-benzoquinol methylase UbiE [Bacteroidota bacterium]
MYKVIKPYKNLSTSKKEQVALMFNNIAKSYDFLNHFLSLNIDKYWRRKTIKILKQSIKNSNDSVILDIATGTGDLAIEASKINPKKIIGVDISTKMLEIGQEKIKQKGLSNLIELKKGDAENLTFENNFFDAIIVAFGVRNFENLSKGLSNMYRVLKPNGCVIILEFSKPKLFLIKNIYNFYFLKILPFFGNMFSKDKFAYNYLPNSVLNFPEANDFINELNALGFVNTKYKKLTFGIATIYWGFKK